MKVWTTSYTDTKFSKYIRERDKDCRRCKWRSSSDCSHFWRRGHSATRYDPENCVGLCRLCHDIWEHQKNNEYKDFMVEWLGQEKYDLLEKKARSYKNRAEAVAEAKQWLS